MDATALVVVVAIVAAYAAAAVAVSRRRARRGPRVTMTKHDPMQTRERW